MDITSRIENEILVKIQKLATTAKSYDSFSRSSGRINEDLYFEGKHVNTFLEVVHEQVPFPAKILDPANNCKEAPHVNCF